MAVAQDAKRAGVAFVVCGLLGGGALYEGGPLDAALAGSIGGFQGLVDLTVEHEGARTILATMDLAPQDGAGKATTIAWSIDPDTRSSRAVDGLDGGPYLVRAHFNWSSSAAQGSGDHALLLTPSDCGERGTARVTFRINSTRGISIVGSDVRCL